MKSSTLPSVSAALGTAFLLISACAPAVTTLPAPDNNGTAQTSSGPLRPTGYRSEFGTMWTFDAPPMEYWRTTYNFSPDQRWLDHVRLAAVRLPNCSASFVSVNGLVLSNHHCARSCTDAVSPKDTNYMETGYMARNAAEEKKCPGLYVDQLESIENVTPRVRAAITGATADIQSAQRSAVITQIQNECSQARQLTCQVVSLYQGGIYSLYRYRRFTDLRLVWVPEESVASFGGDPDNFTYPRYDLDASLFRVYVNDQPFAPTDYLKWSPAGSVENELIFVVGNPGSTGRLNTVAQMEFLRDAGYPAQLGGYKRAIGIYNELARTDSSAARRYQNELFSQMNSQKAVTGYRAGLMDTAAMATKRAFERDFRARIAANPQLQAQYGGVYDAIAAAQRELASFDIQRRNYSYGPAATSGGSRLLGWASQLVRLPRELALPDSSRLTAYRGNAANTIRAALLTNNAPVDTAYERLSIAAQLRAAQSELPPGDSYLAAALAGRAPAEVAAEMVRNTRIGDPAFRKSLIDRGATAVAASTDPLIVFARAIDPLNRQVLARQARLNAVITANTEKLGRALYETYGTALPPDATFTLRISDGVVKGYAMNGTIAPYKTSYAGMYARSVEFDGKPPFNLPSRWLAGQSRLDLTTPYDFVSTNDIIGGNSGSPLVNRNAELVGLAFDSNIEGVANRFLVNTTAQRTVSVSSRAITEALWKIFDGARIADELQGR